MKEEEREERKGGGEGGNGRERNTGEGGNERLVISMWSIIVIVQGTPERAAITTSGFQQLCAGVGAGAKY